MLVSYLLKHVASSLDGEGGSQSAWYQRETWPREQSQRSSFLEISLSSCALPQLLLRGCIQGPEGPGVVLLVQVEGGDDDNVSSSSPGVTLLCGVGLYLRLTSNASTSNATDKIVSLQALAVVEVFQRHVAVTVTHHRASEPCTSA
eukprot:m.33830 g.33830  ORF g.33830 m.33830 type:complete len:146 (+) comp12261_c0_seq2:1399-1836(+)